MSTIEDILKFYNAEQQERIRFAYDVADKALAGKVRENGHPFIEHPLGTASILAGSLQYDAIMAVFLHEAIRFDGEAAQLPFTAFPPEVWKMAEALNHIAAIKPKDTHLEAENYKRLIVNYSKDPRVIVVKLADRLDVMRNVKLLPRTSFERKVTETILLYVPLAHQLGLYKIKSELEDIYFKCAEPERYREITNLLKATERDREKLTESFINPLSERLAAAGIKARLKSRTKTAYSIYRKMHKQGVPFSQVYDILAIRIIIDCPLNEEKDMCWRAYSLVTEEYIPDTSRLRDWITNPKKNGYESLHITVSDDNGSCVEIQIRTERMDIVAENGVASHWSYKGLKREGELTDWLAVVRHNMESSDHNDYENPVGVMKNEVFVFTPDGELRRLPADACILDFAFDIHSNLGLRCSGALVDGKPASIKDRMKTGSVISIITSKNQKPSADWLNYVVTSKARSKIRQKLREEELTKVAAGKELLNRRLKNWKLELSDENLAALCKKYKLKTIHEFFAAVADERIDVMDVKDYLTRKEDTPLAPEQKKYSDRIDESDAKGDYLVIDGHLGNIGYKMAKCCNPIYGDEVFGFVSIKEGIKIHRMSCPNAARLLETYPYRIQKVRWRENAVNGKFQTSLKVIVEEASVYASVLTAVNAFMVALRSSSLVPRTGRNSSEFEIRIQLLVSSNAQLDKILSALKRTHGVISAGKAVE
ncbi:MAG: bifunctional (p)ppGpp synthetase/guanosine-3',5'-bis(diphosphate) 3'-pyrophosphohydrolase [Alistipes sp.]|nr:bifunctional (p)ppGpp synthetase/guanosine-3',5'-bis(diphosphate) 3'-pyrophosphohydrolase [Candidatus Minthomonas equi]